ncbi:hypothetical protein E2C01_025819 [Portunus trituberculatus]|uniref:Uncharacterized protein n=1 Tax=Portunus trituberculatus TaxID=210409 RepID=A0A5B7EH56_PORTR|nr:hypothetical protein [Portunus trituberculatus]
MKFRSLPDVPNSYLQFTTDQGHSPDKDDKCLYYEIQPDLKARGVMESLPTRSQPTISNLHHQSTTGQEHFLNQHNEYFYYEILPDLTSHRVMVSCPAQDSEEPFYTNLKSKYDKQPRSPLYRNVSTRGSHASPLCHQEPTCVSESHIYATGGQQLWLTVCRHLIALLAATTSPHLLTATSQVTRLGLRTVHRT